MHESLRCDCGGSQARYANSNVFCELNRESICQVTEVYLKLSDGLEHTVKSECIEIEV